jgi:hypothetical protein
MLGVSEEIRFKVQRRNARDGRLYDIDLLPSGVTPETAVQRLGAGEFRLLPIDADGEVVGDAIPYNVDPGHYMLRGQAPAAIPGQAPAGVGQVDVASQVQMLLDPVLQRLDERAAGLDKREAALLELRRELEGDRQALNLMAADASSKTTEVLLEGERQRNQTTVETLTGLMTGAQQMIVGALTAAQEAQDKRYQNMLEQQRQDAKAKAQELTDFFERRRQQDLQAEEHRRQLDEKAREAEEKRQERLEQRETELAKMKLKLEARIAEKEKDLQEQILNAKISEVEKGSALGQLSQLADLKEQLKAAGLGGDENKSWVSELRETITEIAKVGTELQNAKLKGDLLRAQMAAGMDPDEMYDDEPDEPQPQQPQQPQQRALPAPQPTQYVDQPGELPAGWVYVETEHGLMPVMQHMADPEYIVYATNDPRQAQAVPVPRADQAFQEAAAPAQAAPRPAPAPAPPQHPRPGPKLIEWNQKLFAQLARQISADKTPQEKTETVTGAIGTYHKHMLPYLQWMGVYPALVKGGVVPAEALQIIEALQSPENQALYRKGLLEQHNITPADLNWAAP